MRTHNRMDWTRSKLYTNDHGIDCGTRCMALPLQDQWLETYAGYGRTDPEYTLAAASTDENGSSLSSVESA
jgi:hypothetical protein